ncbi:hypothetical protein Taro_038903 [Colocasia esculenta]|uniref:Protein ENDOSPERM DEFECTIVE 1 n=1 Tax=Colocasia esculenta TaxID=4460 RepID=A0A843WKL0_COLES|nr:hypothetical protein [Colocasia esculenta]
MGPIGTLPIPTAPKVGISSSNPRAIGRCCVALFTSIPCQTTPFFPTATSLSRDPSGLWSKPCQRAERSREPAMESPREQPPPNPPSTPRSDAEAAAAQEDKKPPRAQRRAREVSSRYMVAIASPSVPPPSSSSSSSSAGGAPSCPALPPPPPRKPQPMQKHHHPALFPSAAGAAASAFTAAGDGDRARARRSPSPQPRRPLTPSPSDIGDSDGEGSWYGDENRPEAPPQTVSRSLETPIPSGLPAKDPGTQRRRAVRLFREIGGEQQQPPPSDHRKPPESFNYRVIESRFLSRKLRPGTPVVHLPERPAAAASTPRPAAEGPTLARSVNARTAPRRTTTSQVSRSLQETLVGAGQPPRVPGTPPPPPSDREISSRSVETSPENSTATDFSEAETCSISSPGGLCDSPPIGNQSSRARMSSECRSSMPEADLLPTMSSRFMAEGNLNQLDGTTGSTSSHRALSSSLCHRSLNSALSSCQQRQLNPTMSISRLPSSLRSPSSSVRGETFCLPPQPATGKVSLDSRKGRKISSRQEDAHALRLLENRYLQWRFVNARAQAAVQARKIAAERSLYGVSCKLSELHESVTAKSIEFGQLNRMTSVSRILEAQMPFLGEWVSLEDDYSHSLSGAIKSLHDASLRLPISGNVRADIRELGEALYSATNVLDVLAPRVGSLETKADGTQVVLSDLAKVVSEERALLEQFEELLADAHKLQV